MSDETILALYWWVGAIGILGVLVFAAVIAPLQVFMWCRYGRHYRLIRDAYDETGELKREYKKMYR